MPEKEKPKARVSALLYPDKGFLRAAAESGELERLLGIPAQRCRCSRCARGVFVRLDAPGNASLGERFFDWQRPQGQSYSVGTLKPSSEIASIVGDRSGGFVDKDGRPLPAIPARILADVESYRQAVDK